VEEGGRGRSVGRGDDARMKCQNFEFSSK